jgi:hypothetical protein
VTAPARPSPFALLFGPLAPDRFPALRAALEAAGSPPEDRERFLLLREVAELLRELRPEEGVGEAVQALVALLHVSYLYWAAGERLCALGEAELRLLTSGETPPPSGGPSARPAAALTRYVQLPPLKVWATAVAGQPAEPLDGWFVTREGDRLAVLAIFGLSAARGGLTAVEVAGSRPAPGRRPDGTPPFAPLLEGGAAAGLFSLTGEAELLELAWREVER